MEIKIERETKWIVDEIKTCYYIWVDGKCTAVSNTEAEAMNIVDKLKSSPDKIGSEIIFIETI